MCFSFYQFSSGLAGGKCGRRPEAGGLAGGKFGRRPEDWPEENLAGGRRPEERPEAKKAGAPAMPEAGGRRISSKCTLI